MFSPLADQADRNGISDLVEAVDSLLGENEEEEVMGGVIAGISNAAGEPTVGPSLGAINAGHPISGLGAGSAIQGIAASGATGSSGANSIASLQAQVAHLTKLVHILWKEVHHVEQVLHIDHAGVHLKVGSSSLNVLHTGVVLDATRIDHKTPSKTQTLP